MRWGAYRTLFWSAGPSEPAFFLNSLWNVTVSWNSDTLIPLDCAFGFRWFGSRWDGPASLAGFHSFKDWILFPLEWEQKFLPSTGCGTSCPAVKAASEKTQLGTRNIAAFEEKRENPSCLSPPYFWAGESFFLPAGLARAQLLAPREGSARLWKGLQRTAPGRHRAAFLPV